MFSRLSPNYAVPMGPPAYDFWLVDLDGTLVDIEWSYRREVFDGIGDRLGRSFSDTEVESIWYGFGGSPDEYLHERGIDPDRFWSAFHAVEDPLARAEATYLYDDAVFVAGLDTPIGVVTHCQRYLTDAVLDRLDIRDWFDAIVCCTDDLGWKPNPEPVRQSMRNLGVSTAHRGVLVGDGPSDIGAAWNAGLDGIHVERHSPSRRRQCVLGDYRIRSFEDLHTVGATD